MVWQCTDLFSNVGTKSLDDDAMLMISGHQNWSFPSCSLPQCQNKSLCETIVMKMHFICKFIFMHIKTIFIRKVLHKDSF